MDGATMGNKYAIVEVETGKIRADKRSKTPLIFETRYHACNYLKKINGTKNRYTSEIIEVEVSIKKV